MVQGSWVGDPLPVAFFLLSFFVWSSSLMSESVAWDGVGCFTYVALSLSFSSLLSFLGIDAC